MKKILVIEDEKNIRNRIVDTLELSNEAYQVFTAENGRIGVDVAQEELPDLIISDVMMPEMDGYEVLKALRSNDETASIPFIFLSAKADMAHIREGMNLGADDYLPKPFSIDELLRTVAMRLAKFEAHEKRSKQELEEVRLRIASSLPHEFRTPLAGLIGFAEMLKNYKQFDDETVNMMIDQVRGNSERLQRLVENFLLYAQIEMSILRSGGTAKLFQEDRLTIVPELITSAVDAIAERHKRIDDLECSVENHVLTLMAHNLKKVVEELVDNALKFSAKSTKVRVDARRTDDSYYTITVSDTGRGMSKEDLENIAAYTQFDRETHEQQGMGLGLTISRRIIEGHHGTMEIASTPGQGTTVTLKLPILPE
ncbi:MAG: hybrid sensor histidine kinase/response regulator [Candidatus Kapaibacterium sp.]|nr:MAG: hybrid sensor histidine kinase/response regulator [Candidatus Kapabacteria bacterium]